MRIDGAYSGVFLEGLPTVIATSARLAKPLGQIDENSPSIQERASASSDLATRPGKTAASLRETGAATEELSAAVYLHVGETRGSKSVSRAAPMTLALSIISSTSTYSSGLCASSRIPGP